jgi:hypothetical protein
MDAAADFDRWKLSEKGVDRNAEETYLGTVSVGRCRAKNILPNIRQRRRVLKPRWILAD